MDIHWDSGWPKMVKFYKTRIEWQFRHMNIHNTSNEQSKHDFVKSPTFLENYQKIRIYCFGHLEYVFRQKK